MLYFRGAVAFVAMAVASAHVFAADVAVSGRSPDAHFNDCHCAQYKSLAGLSDFGQKVAVAGARGLHDEGGEFASLESRYAALVPPECREKVFGGKVPVSIVTRTVIEKQVPYVESSAAASRLLGGYTALQLSFKAGCPYPANVNPHTLKARENCLLMNRPVAYESFRSFLAQSPGVVLNKILGGAPGAPLNTFTRDDIALLKYYDDILNAGSQDAALAYLKGVSPKMSTPQKLALVAMFGSRFDMDYDTARNEAKASAVGAVTFDELLRAAKDNTKIGYYGGASPVKSAAEYEGVCRDIASAQGLMLQALGFRNTYAVSQVQRSGSYHVTVITRDPTDDKKVYRLNYGALHEAISGDNRASNNGPKDVSISYRYFLPGGREVKEIQSELGTTLMTMAGGDMKEYDPLARPKGQLAGVNVAVSDKIPVTARVGLATDGLGGAYGFAGATYERGNAGLFPTRVGVVAATQYRDAVTFGEPGKDSASLDIIYALLEQRFRSPDLKLSPDVQARVEAMASLIFAMSRTRGGADDGSVAVQGSLYLSGQARVDQKAWEDRIRATYKVGVQVVPGLKDVRDVQMPQLPVAVLNQFYFSAEGRMKLSQSPEGNAYLVAATLVLLDQLGARGRAELGLASDKVAITFATEGRLTNETPPYQDGTARTASATVQWSPRPNVKVGLTAARALESGVAPGMSLMGSLRYDH